ncbi:hypothetical protein TSACC_2526 [Terrimicrobium sacchariphilum]|uniref:Uncharacterized protein n=1 Tax=Terrimicrobium sacchariphilum TaxID=690879 RepID=A0A146G2P7_TERSA|nr:hypothetical protein [Terrimicrobium sacchariphilum]GAT32129.1 hypothetical protein TSACC_2526 [Terrimicrobium sacchariphilum]
MRVTTLASLLLAALLLSSCNFLPKTTASSTEKGKVLKVYQASEGTATFLAYVVERKGQEIVVSSPLGGTPRAIGDEIEYFAQTMEISGHPPILSFMYIGPRPSATPTPAKP